MVSQDRQQLFVTPKLTWIFEVKIKVSCQRHQTLICRRCQRRRPQIDDWVIDTDGKLIADVVHTGDLQCQQYKVPYMLH